MEKHNTAHAIFTSGEKVAEIKDDVWQYDFGQILQIEGLSLPPTVEVHYANKGKDIALPQTGVTEGGITTAPIPNEILEEKGSFTAYIFVTDGESGETCYTINGYVNKRPRVKGFNAPEDQEILHAAVGAVNAAAERAESAETKATEAAKQTAEDAKQTAADRAETERLVESVSGIDEQVATVENLTKQAQTSATNAALSEQAAKTAETNAQTAQAGAETAEGNAELAERNAKASEQAVETAKQLVTQMGQEVLDNKNHVDQTVQAFDQTAQQAVANVNNAGQTQTERVQSAGNTATESVKTAQTAATQAIETAKTEAVKAVQAEGTTQTGNVTAEGAKQVQAVQAAAQEIMADREQIAQNKADIAGIKEEMDNLSPAIVDTATGESIVVEDSSSNKFRGLSIYGKSEQVQTTGAQLFDFENAMQKKIENWMSTNILSAQNTNDISMDWKCLKGTAQSYITVVSPFEFEAQKTVYLNINKINAQHLLVYDATGKTKQDLYANSYTPTENFSGYIGIGIDKGRDVNGALICGYTSDFSATEPYTGGKPSPSLEYPQEIANAGDKGNIGVDVYGGNLLNITDSENSSTKITVDGDLITVNSKITTEHTYANCRYNFSLNPGLYILEADELKGEFAENSFKLELKADNVRVTAFNNNSHKTTFTIDKKANMYLYIYNGYKEAGKSYTIKGLRLTAVKELQWEPYKPVQTLTIPTPNGLPGIKVDSGGNYTDASGQQWVCDEIDLERGKYVQRIYSCRKEDYSIVKWSNGEYFVICCEVPTPSVKEKAVCSVTNIISSSWANGAKPHYFLQTNGQKVIIALGVDYCFSETEMRKILDRGIEFIYVLESPIEHDLPPEVIEAYKKLHTNYPVTTVLNDAGAGISMSYVADTKNYINKKFEELNAKIVNTQIALL